MPESAIAPFRDDIARARALVAHAKTLPTGTDSEKLFRDDILRSGWMFAVAAMDAYFCDAYTDLIAATLMAKNNQPAVVLPDFIGKIEIPVTAVLENYGVRQNWKWRMAARQMMANENALKIDTIKSWFNRFCRPGQKMFKDVIPIWIAKPNSTARVFGLDPANYTPASQSAANESLIARFEAIVQRRHDCIHTCDRPANAPQPISSAGTVSNVIRDIEFIVDQSDLHIDTEFRIWLTNCGFSAVTANQVGY